MLKTSIYCAIVIATAIGTDSLCAQGKNPPALQADIVTSFSTSTGVKYSTPGHYYRSQDGRMREDSAIGSIIMDAKAHTVTLLNFGTKEATVISTANEIRPAASAALAAQPVEPFETATIEGHTVAKTRTQSAAGGSQEVWTAKDIQLAVFSKQSAPDRTMTRTLSNFSLREPDPAVFKIPAGYTITHKAGPLPNPGPAPVSPKPPAPHK